MSSILLVEDDDQVRTLLKLLLTNAGYLVCEARNGKGVNDLYQQHQPDLVITDLIMPEKEGLELIMELRSRDPKLKIIAMSGGGLGSTVKYLPMAQKLGAQFTLAKPFDNDEFLATVRMALAS
jgi:DNA-binding NtrC family response regulator